MATSMFEHVREGRRQPGGIHNTRVDPEAPFCQMNQA
jgi:hypothetical protein